MYFHVREAVRAAIFHRADIAKRGYEWPSDSLADRKLISEVITRKAFLDWAQEEQQTVESGRFGISNFLCNMRQTSTK